MAAERSRSHAFPEMPQQAAHVAAVDAGAQKVGTTWPGGRMTWRIWGSGPPLLLLHGDFGSWTHWIRNVLPLAAEFRVIAPDMPGYGDSDSPADDWSPASLAGTLAAGLAEIIPGSQSYSLAGFSFGGIIAGHLAAEDVGRVGKLILIGAGGFGLPYPSLPRLKRLEGGMTAEEVIAAHRHNLASLMIADPAKADDLAVHVQIENVRRARVRAGDLPVSDILLRALERAQPRLGGLWGERDAMSGPTIPEREATLRHYDPDLDFRIVPAAGHWAPFEAPDFVNRALLDMAGPSPVKSPPDSR